MDNSDESVDNSPNAHLHTWGVQAGTPQTACTPCTPHTPEDANTQNAHLHTPEMKCGHGVVGGCQECNKEVRQAVREGMKERFAREQVFGRKREEEKIEWVD